MVVVGVIFSAFSSQEMENRNNGRTGDLIVLDLITGLLYI